jgi:site-specific DNA-methyltransferase (adenine-specific)
MLELNKIFHGDCLEVMKEIDDKSIDMVITSPPYDNLRSYNGYIFNFEEIAKELFRIIKDGGVVVWIVGDATIKGSETGTSFKQALYFKEIGFNLHDTMIYDKINYIPLTHNRYEQEFEYMFIFSKNKPNIFNPIKIECKSKGSKTNGRTFYQTKTDNIPTKGHNNNIVANEKIKGNVWHLSTNSNIKGHPAPFPIQLAIDHILSWSNPSDIILDPMIGSGTTAIACLNTGRYYIGIEISKEYVDICNKRISDWWG